MAADDLPVTNDPFALLGVSRECDPRELKRAYARLIKKYRPDEHPEAFMHIRAAYEAARDGRDVMPTRVAPRAATAPPQDPTPTSNGPRNNGGNSTPATPTVTTFDDWRSQRFSDDVTHITLGVQLAQQTPQPAQALAEVWTLGLERGLDLARLQHHLTDAVLALLWTQGTLSWTVLRQQPDRDFAVFLFQQGIEIEGAERLSDVLLQHLSNSLLRQDVSTYPALGALVGRILLLASWDAPGAVASAMATFDAQNNPTDPSFERLPAVLSAARAWPAFASTLDDSAAIGGFLHATLVQPEGARARCQAALADFEANGSGWVSTLDHLATHHRDATTYLLMSLESWVPPDPRHWDELTRDERAWLRARLLALDRQLDKDLSNAIYGRTTVLALLGAVASFFVLGWWGLAVLGAALGGWLVSEPFFQGRLYARKVRPFLVTRVVVKGFSPEQAVDCIDGLFPRAVNIERLTSKISHYSGRIEKDAGLHLLGALHRFRLAGAARTTVG